MPYLPPPTHSFSIPSVSDGLQLACRIYLPQEVTESERAAQWRVRGAIVAHPYAPLGGSYDDPVVSFLGRELLDAGCVVGTFNFRGAGDSAGRTSWTAKPELADYVSFYGFMMFYLNFLEIRASQKSGGDATSREGSDNSLGQETPSPKIILGGYSYGSLMAQYCPPISVILDLIRDDSSSPLLHEIFIAAKKVAIWLEDNVLTHASSSELKTTYAQRSMGEILEEFKPTISYLLVSPLLPPVNMFLTLFSTLSLEVGTHPSGEMRQIACPKPDDQLCRQHTLAIYGDQDTFTSVTKLRNWSDELAQTPLSKFRSAEIQGAGHFWREDGVELQARNVLRDWLRQQSENLTQRSSPRI